MSENFTLYTEVDAYGVLTVTAPKISALGCGRDKDAYAYFDFGANYFDSLNATFTVYLSSGSSLYADAAFNGFSNTVNDCHSWASTDISTQFNKGIASTRLFLIRGVWTSTDAYVATENTLYYCLLERSAGSDTATLKIYSDSGRTNLLDTLSVSGFSTTKYRYCYGFASYNDATALAALNGYTQDLVLILHPLPVVDGDLIGIAIIRKS